MNQESKFDFKRQTNSHVATFPWGKSSITPIFVSVNCFWWIFAPSLWVHGYACSSAERVKKHLNLRDCDSWSRVLFPCRDKKNLCNKKSFQLKPVGHKNGTQVRTDMANIPKFSRPALHSQVSKLSSLAFVHVEKSIAQPFEIEYDNTILPRNHWASKIFGRGSRCFDIGRICAYLIDLFAIQTFKAELSNQTEFALKGFIWQKARRNAWKEIRCIPLNTILLVNVHLD